MIWWLIYIGIAGMLGMLEVAILCEADDAVEFVVYNILSFMIIVILVAIPLGIIL